MLVIRNNDELVGVNRRKQLPKTVKESNQLIYDLARANLIAMHSQEVDIERNDFAFLFREYCKITKAIETIDNKVYGNFH